MPPLATSPTDLFFTPVQQGNPSRAPFQRFENAVAALRISFHDFT